VVTALRTIARRSAPTLAPLPTSGRYAATPEASGYDECVRWPRAARYIGDYYAYIDNWSDVRVVLLQLAGIDVVSNAFWEVPLPDLTDDEMYQRAADAAH
jgi:hypothetical protein